MTAIVLAFAVLPFVLTVSVPRRWFGLYMASAMLFFGLFYLEQQHVAQSGNGFAIGMGIFMFLWGALSFGLGVLVRFFLIGRRPTSDAVSTAAPCRLSIVTRLITIEISSLLAIGVLSALSQWLKEVQPGWLSHVIVIAIASAIWGAMFVVEWIYGSVIKWLKYLAIIRWTVVVIFGTSVLLSLANIVVVSNRAEAIAGNNPYCIQVADNGNYKEARTLLDLSGINMRASGPPYWIHHATLVVRDRLLHWSYHKQDFVSGVINTPAILCTPHSHFARTLPEFSNTDPVSLNARVAGMAFLVPAAYRARIHGASSNSSSGPGILFYAASPNFAPVEMKSPGARRLTIDEVGKSVEVEFRRTNRLETRLAITDQSHIVENSEETFGLKKHLIWYVDPPARVRTRPPYFQYFSEVNSHVVTLIDCPEGTEGWCMHTFYHNDWTYIFKHSPSDLPHWKTMQLSLIALTNSFRIKKDIDSMNDASETRKVR